MNMSKYFFKLLCITAILGYMSEGYAQSTDSLSHRKLDTRQHQGYTGWKRIVPTHVKAQYAGGMGVMSVGGGWDYGQKCRWETDLLMGYLPQRYSDAFHVTFTLKQNYIPWSIRCHERFSIDPLTASMYINLIAGDEYWVREPDPNPSVSLVFLFCHARYAASHVNLCLFCAGIIFNTRVVVLSCIVRGVAWTGR